MVEFNENGDISNYTSLIDRLGSGERLDGEDAIAFLAEEFAYETHGNYCAETLYLRADVGKRYKVTVRPLLNVDEEE